MQRKHQVRPPGLLNGMAVAFTEETLRALQDALSIHQAIFAEYATVPTLSRPRSTCHHPHRKEPGDVFEGLSGGRSLACMSSVCNKAGLEAAILV